MFPCTLTFKAAENMRLFKNDNSAIKLDHGLSLELHYDFREAPLKLSADAKPGDEIRLTLTDTHIALFVNDELTDEEWPCGNPRFDLTNLADDVLLTPGVESSEILLRRGITAEELRRPGVNIGDCMPFTGSDGRYHLYWLYDRHHHSSKWGRGAHQWAHSSTADLISWDEHPMAVPITEQYEGSICTGSTIEADGKFYCWYAIRMSDGSPARLTSSISENGFDYVKSGRFFILPERYHRASARDPKVIFRYGKYHMLVTTTLLESGNGCLAHLVSDSADMSDFTDLGPIIEWNDGSQPECPDYFEFGGRFYLVWSILGKARYVFSDKPFGEGGWTTPDDNTIDCGTVPKAAFCPWNGTLVFAGFVSAVGYAGSLILKSATAREDGTLELHQIEA